MKKPPLKPFVIALLSLACISTLASCTPSPVYPNQPSSSSMPSVYQKPEDTNLEFWITEDVGQVDFSVYQETSFMYGAKEFYGTGYQAVFDEAGNTTRPDHYVIYCITAYPDYADGGQYVTGIEITDPHITCYGLTVDASLEDFDKIFSDMGFTVSSPSKVTHRAVKDNITFLFEQGKRLKIDAKISNRDGIVY